MANTSKFSMSAVLSLVDNMTNPYKKTTSKITALNKSIGGSFSTIGRGAKKAGIAMGVGITAGITGVTIALKGLMREASKIEDATASFTPLLGSVEKATELVARLNKEAASTPFQFGGIASVAKQLLPVMNGSIEDTADTFRMLGDTAGGNIQKLESITRGYTKALLKGKPDMEALNMISEAGVPIFTEMASSMGITVDQLFELSKQGKLTNKDLTKTFKKMTKEGGVFFKGMEIASLTLTGKLSTLKDNISLTVATLGKALLPTIKKLVDKGIEFAQVVRGWVDNNKLFIALKMGVVINKIKTSVRKVKTAFENFIKIVDSVKIALSNLWDLMMKNGAINGIITKAIELGEKFKETFIANGVENIKKITTFIEGINFAPIVDGIGFVIGVFQKLGQFIMEHKRAIENLVIGLVSFKIAVLAVNAVMAAQKIIFAITQAGVWGTIIAYMDLIKTEGLLKVAQLGLNTAMKANIIGIIITAVTLLIMGFIKLVQKTGGVKEAFQAIGKVFATIGKVMLKGLEMVGRGLMTWLLAPINLVISALAFLLGAINRVPGVAGKLDGALAGLKAFQDKMNVVTLVGGDDKEQPQSSTETARTRIQDIQNEKQKRQQESTQRNDFYLHGPSGYGISDTPGGAPKTAVSVGPQ